VRASAPAARSSPTSSNSDSGAWSNGQGAQPLPIDAATLDPASPRATPTEA
jgi:hypothetical protein